MNFFLMWNIRCMHDLLVNDDAKGLKRNTGVSKSSVDTLSAGAVIIQHSCIQGANLCGCMLGYSIGVGLEHYIVHYPSGCSKFFGAESFLCYCCCLRYFSSLVFRVRFLQHQRLAYEALSE